MAAWFYYAYITRIQPTHTATGVLTYVGPGDVGHDKLPVIKSVISLCGLQ